MAKFLFTALIGAARGKFGNAVFTQNASGTMIRQLAIPTNPRTAKQQAVRATFGQVSQAWRGLTDDQRSQWNAAVQDWQQTDALGQNVTLTGSQLYSKLNNSLRQLGRPAITTPPTIVDLPGATLNVNLNVNGNVVTFSPSVNYPGGFNAAVGPGFNLVIYATRPMSEGLMSPPESAFRLITNHAITNQAGENITLQEDYEQDFGALPVGSKIFFKTQVVNPNTGQRSTPVYSSVIISLT